MTTVKTMGFDVEPYATIDYDGQFRTRCYSTTELNNEIQHFIAGDTFKGEQTNATIYYHGSEVVEKIKKGVA